MSLSFTPLPKGPAGSRLTTARKAYRLAEKLGIPPEEVITRWRAGLHWCKDRHEWRTDEDRAQVRRRGAA